MFKIEIPNENGKDEFTVDRDDFDTLPRFQTLIKLLAASKSDEKKLESRFSLLKGKVGFAAKTLAAEEDRLRLQRMWSLICAAIAPAPKLSSKGFPAGDGKGNYELPIPFDKKAQASSTSVSRGSFYDGADEEPFETWHNQQKSHIVKLTIFEKTLVYDADTMSAGSKVIVDQEWWQIAFSVWMLSRKYPFFEAFFPTVAGKIAKIDEINKDRDSSLFVDTTKVRIRPLLRKIIAGNDSYSSQQIAKMLDGYKGACSEILNAFDVLTFRPSVTGVALPRDKAKVLGGRIEKQFEQIDYPLAEESSILFQDIDVTIILYNEFKFYVEVKADVHTAAQKHGVVKCEQLNRIVAVVMNRARKDQAKPATQETSGNATVSKLRIPAVSIVNPSGWPELFIGITADNYIDLYFWLLLDGVFISATGLKLVRDKVKPELDGYSKAQALDAEKKLGRFSSYVKSIPGIDRHLF